MENDQSGNREKGSLMYEGKKSQMVRKNTALGETYDVKAAQTLDGS